jgi:hypothetical protein
MDMNRFVVKLLLSLALSMVGLTDCLPALRVAA